MTDMNTQNSPDPSDWQGLPEQESPINKPEMPSQTPPNGIPEQPTSAPAEQQTILSRHKRLARFLAISLWVLPYCFLSASNYLPTCLTLILSWCFCQGKPCHCFWRIVAPGNTCAGAWGGIIHIGLNMYALYILGRDVESLFGHGRFVLLYLLSAFGGNVLSFAFSEAISVGASTAIFGLIGAQAVFIGKNRKFWQPRATDAF